MAEKITLDWLGQQMQTLIGEVREMRAELSAMRSEIDGAFHMMRGTDTRVEGLRRIIDAHGQRITALERKP
jgi:hypothetical protein